MQKYAIGTMSYQTSMKQLELAAISITNPAITLRKSNVILWLYFGNLPKLLSANVDVT